MKRAASISLPSRSSMSSSSMPKSGSVICEASCMAREVRPILWPMTRRPFDLLDLHPLALDRVAVLDRHRRMAFGEVADLLARLFRLMEFTRQGDV